MVAMHLMFLWNMRNRISRGDPDFTAFYTAGWLLRSGHGAQLYDPGAQFRLQQQFTADPEIRRGPLRYIHPPFEALLFVPFTFLPYRSAFVLWDLVNLALLAVAGVLLRTLTLSNTSIHAGDVVLGLLAFFPVYANFFQGQDAILLLLIVILSLRALVAKADFMAGCWLAIGLFRFQLVIPLVLVLAIWGRRRLATGFAATAAALALISAVIVGWNALIGYPRYLWLWTSVSGFGRTPPSLLPSLIGLMTGWQSLNPIHWLLLRLALILSAGLLIVVARMKRQARQPESVGLWFGCAILVALLLGYNTSAYDLSLLAVPIAVVLGEGTKRLDARMPGFLLGPMVPLLISPLWFAIGMYWHHFNVITIFLLAWFFGMRKELARTGESVPPPQLVSRSS